MKKIILILATVSALAASAFGYRQYLVAELKRPVAYMAVDPDSVRFRNLRILSDWSPRGSMLCGEMNARNRAGGYEGHQKFVVMSDGFMLIGGGEVEAMCSVLDDPSPWWYVPQ